MRQRRVVVAHYGGPEVLRIVDEECPQPEPGDVRVRVLAAGVSLPDVMMREGVHPETPRLPFTPGWDLVGVVDRLGAGVSGVEPGQLVAALPIHGAYAEFVCLHQRELVPVPPELDPAEAVSLVLNYVTAQQMLHRLAKVRRGQRVLIHGAAGGVGHFATQLARWHGAHVIATASGDGTEVARGLGAHEVFDRAVDLDGVLEPVDLVFDTAGGASLERSPALVRDGGRLVSVAEEPPEVADGRIATVYFVVEPNRDQLAEIAGLLDGGELESVIDSVFELADGRAAFERSLQPGKRGKVVLRVAG